MNKLLFKLAYPPKPQTACFSLLLFFITVLISSTITAQTCNGTLGSPIFKDDFGAGTGRVPFGSNITTTYNYRSSGNVSDGDYTITNNAGLFGGTVWWPAGDHTGNTNGRMLVVNASYTPGEFFRTTVNGLCANTNFEFSAWIANILGPTGCSPDNPVNVKFQIEDLSGNIIGSNNTGNITKSSGSMLWNRFAFLFNTGANSSVQLVLINNGPGGCGNDLAIDDIAFCPCGPALTFLPVPDQCSESTFTVTVNGANAAYAVPYYQWEKSTDNGVTWVAVGGPTTSNTITETIAVTATSTVLYHVYCAGTLGSLTNPNCRVVSNPFPVKINKLPIATFTPQVPQCENTHITFVSSNTNVDFSWTFQNGTPASSTLANPAIKWTTAGTYAVNLIVTDKTTHCVSKATDANQNVTIYSNPTISVLPGDKAYFCEGQYATLTAVTNGNQYSWTKGGAIIGTTPSILVNATGNYEVTVTNSNGCTNTGTIVVNKSKAVLATLSTTPIKCFGDLTGTATVTIITGTEPYTYEWKNSGGIIIGETAASISNFAAGTYTVVVTDGSGCTVQENTAITGPSAPLSTSISATGSTCALSNGTATVVASGGTTNYSYTWNTAPVQTSATATGLAPGTYAVTVKDANACTSTQTIIVSGASGPLVTANVTNNVNCNGGNNGEALANATGGNGTLSYTWNTSPIQTTPKATGLPAGNYTVTVKDINNCSSTATVTITQPAALTVTANTTNVNCNGKNDGSSLAVASGGTTPYTYLWNSTPAQNTAQASNLVAGNYTVLATDANGCTKNTVVIITQPTKIVVSTTTTPVSCFGGTNGKATATITGGVTPYNYEWKDISGVLTGQTTAVASNLLFGNYTVTVTDKNGCSAQQFTAVNSPTQLVGTVSSNNSTCGLANGTATVVATKGTPNYTYNWNTVPVQTTATATGLLANTYSVTVTDANGCTVVKNIVVSATLAPVATATVSNNISCYGGNNGEALASATGGTGTLSYTWSTNPIQTTVKATGLTAGTYTVTVKDANNCSAIAIVVVPQPSVITASTSSVNPSCNGKNNGGASVTASGGTAPYTYLWNSTPAQNTAQATNLFAGSYTVLITDANGCSKSAAVVVGEPAKIAVATSATAVSCYGGFNGTVTAAVTGGTGPYTYEWRGVAGLLNGQTTGNVNSLPAGSYTVTVTDKNSCTLEQTVTITGPSAIIASTSSTGSTCGVNNGTATVTASGGTANYNYSWNTTPVQTTATATGLAPNSYSVKVTDANGCSSTKTVVVSGAPSPLLTTSVTSNITCYGGNNGEALVSTTGGTGTLSYAWSTSPVQTTPKAIGLSVGTYTVTVKDINNCSTTATVTITQPAVIGINPGYAMNASCNGKNDGDALVVISGGTPPYTYLWNSNPTQNTAHATNLPAGSYTILITDANGCNKSKAVVIGEPTKIEVTATANPVSCYGGVDGKGTAVVTGGVGPYNYEWKDAAGLLTGQTGANASNLPAGNYTVTVKDNNGCTITKTAIVTQPTRLDVTVVTTNEACNKSNGTGIATGRGGVGNYSYTWNTNPVKVTPSVTGLMAGDYVVTVKDGNNCIAYKDISISNIAGPTLQATVVKQVSCFGQANGQASTTITFGTAPFTYLWSAIPVQTTADANALRAGNYTVTVKDINNCTATATVSITQPDSLQLTLTTTTPVDCKSNSTGSATVNATGGTTPYNYLWSTSPSQTNATAANLTAGIYTATVTDNKGCSKTKSVSISEPAKLVASITAIDAKCYNGSDGKATVTATGGNAPYQYQWNTAIVQTTAVISGLKARVYNVIVKDAKGCTTTSTTTIGQPDSLQLKTTVKNVLCYGGNNGAATVTVSGGTAGYSFNWKTTPAQITATAANLKAGVYTVVVTDKHNCSNNKTAVISEPAKLITNLTVTAVKCNGEANGGAEVMASGGVTPYQYRWTTTPEQTTNIISNMSAGSYSVFITDANNCTVTLPVIITTPSKLSAAISNVTPVTCFGYENGLATVTATGGSQPYSYEWNSSPLQKTQQANKLKPGSYSVTTVDANGCSVSNTVTVTEPQPLITTISPNDTICPGKTTTITASCKGGSGGYVYVWNNNLPNNASQLVNPAISTIYEVYATDKNGCIGAPKKTSIVVYSLTANDIEINAPDPICKGAITTLKATVSGGGVPGKLTYAWSNGLPAIIGPITIKPAVTTTYTFTATNGCNAKAAKTVTVVVNPLPIIGLAPQVGEACDKVEFAFADTNTANENLRYNWDFGDGTLSGYATPKHTYIKSGNYTVKLKGTDEKGCTTVKVNNYQATIHQTPIADFIPSSNVVTTSKPVIKFTNTTTHANTSTISYSWDFGDETSTREKEPTHTYSARGSYNVKLVCVSQMGCRDTIQKPVEVLPEFAFYIPNSFTPNGDGLNEIFNGVGQDITNLEMHIFSRWGEMVFHTTSIDEGWDGRIKAQEEIAQEDVYVYKIKVWDLENKMHLYYGTVTLIK